MSNETISVPREVLERVCAVRNTANGWAMSADAIRELRALLAQPAEQHQGEPVGHVYTMEALVHGGGVRYHAELYHPLPSGTKLYTEQPAPAAVVLPRRRLIRAENPAARISHSHGWNACLDEVARLNPPQQRPAADC